MDSTTEKNTREYDIHAEEWRAAMPSNVGHKYLEKPAMIGLLPADLSNQSILCIGVGSGEELEELLKRHPAKIIGIDTSIKLLEIAKNKFPSVEFIKMDMNELNLPADSFNLIYSSLAFHYAKDWDILMSGIARVIKKGGILIFSTHNPNYWRLKPATGNFYRNLRGVIVDEYTDILPGKVVITYYSHRNTRDILDAVTNAGFKIEQSFTARMVETDTLPSERETYNKLKEKNLENPLFFIVKAIKF